MVQADRGPPAPLVLDTAFPISRDIGHPNDLAGQIIAHMRPSAEGVDGINQTILATRRYHHLTQCLTQKFGDDVRKRCDELVKQSSDLPLVVELRMKLKKGAKTPELTRWDVVSWESVLPMWLELRKGTHHPLHARRD